MRERDGGVLERLGLDENSLGQPLRHAALLLGWCGLMKRSDTPKKNPQETQEMVLPQGHGHLKVPRSSQAEYVAAALEPSKKKSWFCSGHERLKRWTSGRNSIVILCLIVHHYVSNYVCVTKINDQETESLVPKKNDDIGICVYVPPVTKIIDPQKMDTEMTSHC